MEDMKMFITASFKNGQTRHEIERLCKAVNASGITDFCFIRDIEKYKKIFFDAHKLMTRAKEEIEKCDALLFDGTEDSIGRLIETGMAYAMGKKIVVIIKKGKDVRETLAGVADLVIEYDDIEDITLKLRAFFEGAR